MKENLETLSADDFFEKLQQDKLITETPFSIVGMVKKSDGNEKTIKLAPGGHCSNWVTVPLEFIDRVEMVSTVPCKDHSHPLVKLHMKKPKTAEGQLYFDLLEKMLHSDEVHLPPSKLFHLHGSSGFYIPSINDIPDKSLQECKWFEKSILKYTDQGEWVVVKGWVKECIWPWEERPQKWPWGKDSNPDGWRK
jgi:hypothetical protein